MPSDALGPERLLRSSKRAERGLRLERHLMRLPPIGEDEFLTIVRYVFRSGLPDTCDRCGAPASALVPILYGLVLGRSVLVDRGDVALGGCKVVDETWLCRACGRQG